MEALKHAMNKGVKVEKTLNGCVICFLGVMKAVSVK